MKSNYSILIHKKAGWDTQPPITAKPVASFELGYELIDTKGHSTPNWVTLSGRYIRSSDTSNSTSFLEKTEQDKVNFQSAIAYNIGGISKLKDFTFTMERSDLDLIEFLGCQIEWIEWDGLVATTRFKGKIQRISKSSHNEVTYGCEGVLANAELFITTDSEIVFGDVQDDYVKLRKVTDEVDEQGGVLEYDNDLYVLKGLAIRDSDADMYLDVTSPYTTDENRIYFSGQNNANVPVTYSTATSVVCTLTAFIEVGFTAFNTTELDWKFDSNTIWGGIYSVVSVKYNLGSYLVTFKTTAWGGDPEVVAKILSKGSLWNPTDGDVSGIVSAQVISGAAIANSSNMQKMGATNYWDMFSVDTYGLVFELLPLVAENTSVTSGDQTLPIIAVMPKAGFSAELSFEGSFDVPPIVGESLELVNQHFSDYKYIKFRFQSTLGEWIKINNKGTMQINEERDRVDIQTMGYTKTRIDFTSTFKPKIYGGANDFLACGADILGSIAIQNGNQPYHVLTNVSFVYEDVEVSIWRDLVGESNLILNVDISRRAHLRWGGIFGNISDATLAQTLETIFNRGYFKITHSVYFDSAQATPKAVYLSAHYEGFNFSTSGGFDFGSQEFYGDVAYKTDRSDDVLLDFFHYIPTTNAESIYKLVPASGRVGYRENTSVIIAETSTSGLMQAYKLWTVAIMGTTLSVDTFTQPSSYSCRDLQLRYPDTKGVIKAQANIYKSTPDANVVQPSYGKADPNAGWDWNANDRQNTSDPVDYVGAEAVVEIDDTGRDYLLLTPNKIELWRRHGAVLGDPTNPVVIIQTLLIYYAHIPTPMIDSVAFDLAKDQTVGLRCAYVVKDQVLVNKVVNDIARDFGLIVFERDNGQVSIVHLFPPEEDSVTTILDNTNMSFKGLAYPVTEEFTSLSYLISEMDVEWGKETEEGKYAHSIPSSSLDQTPFVVAKSYLGGVDYSVRLRLVSVVGEHTARECARIKQLYHFEPVRLITLDVNHLAGIQLGDWVKIDQSVLPFAMGKIYLVMKTKKGKDTINIKLYEFDWDTLHEAIQEVPTSSNNNYDEQVTAVDQIEEKPNV